MIKNYLREIQSIYTNVVPHYKSNLIIREKPNLTQLEDLQNVAGFKFSEDLKNFLEWSCFNPIYAAPFLPFTSDGDNFIVWSNRCDIISIKVKSPHYTNRFEIMHGEFIDASGEKNIFDINIDYKGVFSKKLCSVYINYLPSSKINVAGCNPKTILFADNISQFTKDYLVYLHSLPVSKKSSPKINKLLDQPKKLFDYLINYNFDDGLEEVEQVINDKRCDTSCALYIYWALQPYLIYEDDSESLDLLPIKLEKNILNGFYPSSQTDREKLISSISCFVTEYEQSRTKSREVPEYILSIST